MKDLLPPLPVESGFEALRRGIIHGHPAHLWMPAIQYFDWAQPVSIVRARLGGLLSDASIHQRHDEFLELAQWIMDTPDFPASVSRLRAMRGIFTNILIKTPRIPDKIIEWGIEHLFHGKAMTLWNWTTSQSQNNSKAKSIKLGEALIKNEHPENALALIKQIKSKASPREIEKMPWHDYTLLFLQFDQTKMLAGQTDSLIALIKISPDSALPAIGATMRSILAQGCDQKKNAPWRDSHFEGGRLPVTMAILERLGTKIDLRLFPEAWPAILLDASKSCLDVQAMDKHPVLGRLMDELAQHPEIDPTPLLNTIIGWGTCPPEQRQSTVQSWLLARRAPKAVLASRRVRL